MADDVQQWRLIGDHAEDLGDGRTAEVGQFIDADAEFRKGDVFTRLRDDGRIIRTDNQETADPPTRDELLKRAKQLDLNVAANARNDQIAEAIAEAETKKGGDA